jgi:hypothetical protein
VLQVALLARAISTERCPLGWRALAGTAWRTLIASAVMAAVVCKTLVIMPPAISFVWAAARVLLPIGAAGITYVVMFWLLRGPELRMLLGKLPEADFVSCPLSIVSGTAAIGERATKKFESDWTESVELMASRPARPGRTAHSVAEL